MQSTDFDDTLINMPNRIESMLNQTENLQLTFDGVNSIDSIND